MCVCACVYVIGIIHTYIHVYLYGCIMYATMCHYIVNEFASFRSAQSIDGAE